MPTMSNSDRPDVVLIGAGIMSATLGTVLEGARALAHHHDIRDA